MQVDGSPSVLHSCHRVWWLMWLPPCRRTGVDPAESARATWGWQHGSWPVSMSNTASDAFFVKCDAETTTPTDQALGVVNVAVGFAPVRPAEFVVITLQQKTAQAQV